MKRGAWEVLAALTLFACTGEQAQIGVGEPFRVRALDDKSPTPQFIKGKLPGTPPPAGTSRPMAPPPKTDAGRGGDAGPAGPPHLIEFTSSAFVYQGQGGVSIHGTTTDDGYTVGLQLEGFGTGYWVVPVGEIDPAGGRVWSVLGDFDEAIPAGFQTLLGVAFDQNGVAGQQSAKRLCIDSRVPDNFSVCPQGKHPAEPPFAVIALSWDVNADVDLQVSTPEGRLVEPKHPLLTDLDGGPPPKSLDGIDRDSNAGCAADGIRQEDLVFYNGMPHGPYQIFANLFDACKQPAVRFRVDVYSSADLPDGGRRLVHYYPRPEDPQGGELLDISANGGAARGLYVTTFTFH